APAVVPGAPPCLPVGPAHRCRRPPGAGSQDVAASPAPRANRSIPLPLCGNPVGGLRLSYQVDLRSQPMTRGVIVSEPVRASADTPWDGTGPDPGRWWAL